VVAYVSNSWTTAVDNLTPPSPAAWNVPSLLHGYSWARRSPSVQNYSTPPHLPLPPPQPLRLAGSSS
jgi:hypothetical protein